jgi:hypothetical protein
MKTKSLVQSIDFDRYFYSNFLNGIYSKTIATGWTSRSFLGKDSWGAAAWLDQKQGKPTPGRSVLFNTESLNLRLYYL